MTEADVVRPSGVAAGRDEAEQDEHEKQQPDLHVRHLVHRRSLHKANKKNKHVETTRQQTIETVLLFTFKGAATAEFCSSFVS